MGDDGPSLKPIYLESFGGYNTNMNVPKEPSPSVVNEHATQNICDGANEVMNVDTMHVNTVLDPTNVRTIDIPSSYATKLSPSMNSSSVVIVENSTNKVNFCYIESNDTINDVEFIITKLPVEEANIRCANTLYGYFIGQEGGVSVVQHFARTMWTKYGLQKVMMNS